MRHRASNHLPARAAAVLSALALAACAARGPCGEQMPPAPREGSQQDFYLILDYLPTALYVGDGLTACFRVENATKQKAPVALTFDFLDEKRRPLRNDRADGECAPGGFWPYQKTHDLRGVAYATYVLQAGGKEYGRGAIRLIRPDDPMPAAVRSSSFEGTGRQPPKQPSGDALQPDAQAKAGRIWDAATGEQIVFLLNPRLHKEDRRWAPVRWILGEESKLPPPGRSALFAPRMAPPGDAGLAASFLSQVKSQAGSTEVIELDAPAPDGAEPVIEAACRACAWVDGRKREARPDRVIVLLPAQDVEWSTGLREYKLALELLFSRLESAGVGQVAAAPPVSFSAPRKRAELYRELVREVSATYRQIFVDLDPLLADEYWRVSDEATSVFGKYMNAKGRKRLSDELLKWIR